MQNEKAEKLLSEISKRKHVIKSFANAVAGVSFAALTCAASVGEYNLFQKNNEVYAAAVQDHAEGRLHLNQHFLESHELNHLAFARDKNVYAQDAEIQKKLFTPFFTTKEDGTGLGLVTSKKIIEAHGGQITLQSEPGKGSCFTIALPH